MKNINTHDLANTVKDLFAQGKLTVYEKFDLLLKIDQNETLNEIAEKLDCIEMELNIIRNSKK